VENVEYSWAVFVSVGVYVLSIVSVQTYQVLCDADSVKS